MFELRQAFGWLPDAVLFGTGSESMQAVSTDSRSAKAGDLFFALRGESFDAHEFVGDVIDRGAAAVVVERWTDRTAPPALLVPDTRRALGWIAAGWRKRFDLPLIAVTGSNGKTTVKEMVAAILAAHFGATAAFATRGNLNNDVGVPLTLLSLESRHRAAVVELGMNHIGEIAWLASLALPTVALVNNAQREHQEFMAGAQATAVENGAAISALNDDGIAIFPGDDDHTGIWRGLAAGRRTIEFGLTPVADRACRRRCPAGALYGHHRRPVGRTAAQHRRAPQCPQRAGRGGLRARDRGAPRSDRAGTAGVPAGRPDACGACAALPVSD